jgi:DNA-binding LacI/PurR family transcriptional regulator
MNPTIRDVAKLANTSKSTVSRYLNGQKVKKETEEALKKAIEELNFHPNINARRLVMNKTQTIGIVVDDMSIHFYPPIFKGIEAIASKKGFDCVFYSSRSNVNKEMSYLDLLYEGQVDGLILLSFQKRNEEYLNKVSKVNYPIVLIGDSNEERKIDSIDVDNHYGISEMVKYLYEIGHRQIAYISGPNHLSATRDRLEGYYHTMAELDLDVLVISSDWTNIGGYHAMKELLLNKSKMTAVVASNDETAVGALRAIRESGHQVPEDISLTGYDDIAIASWEKPSLTTVRQPFEVVGVKAAERLFEKMENESGSKTRQLLKPRLIIRESSKKIEE